MEMHQIRYFLALREERNFTRAARRCGITQPSLTNAIKRLEDEFGGSLFRRDQSGAELSPLGYAVLPYLRQIDQLAAVAKNEAATFAAATRLASRVNGGIHEQRDLRLDCSDRDPSRGRGRAPIAVGDRVAGRSERDDRPLRTATED